MEEGARELTPEGKKEVRAVTKLAQTTARIAPQVILTSPWSRALETARIAGAVLGCERIVETGSLLPHVPPAHIWREIHQQGARTEVLLAGHEPHMSRLAAFLLEAPVAIDFKKGAMMRIDVQDREGPPRGVLKWYLTPKLAGGK